MKLLYFKGCIRYIRKGIHALGEHFKGKCDSKYLLVQVIEKVIPDSEAFRELREKYWMEKLDTKKPYGLNTVA